MTLAHISQDPDLERPTEVVSKSRGMTLSKLTYQKTEIAAQSYFEQKMLVT